MFEAATVHNKYNKIGEVQVSTLLSVKTGGAPKDFRIAHKLLDTIQG